MATNKKYSINNIIASMPKEDKTEIVPTGECFKEVALQVKRILPLEDAMNFVKDIAATCIDEDEVEYMPEFFDFAVRLYIMMHYANVDLTKDVKKAYRILYGTELFNQTVEHVDKTQLSILIGAAEKRIEHWKSIVVASAAGDVAKLVNKMEEMMESSNAMMESIDGTEFKEAIARLATAGVLKDDGNPLVIDGATENGDGVSDNNVVYLNKEK